METEEMMTCAAMEYAKSQFDAEQIDDKDLYQNSVEFCVQVFKDGAGWAAQNPKSSFDKAEKAAAKYAKENADSADNGIVDEISTDFIEGVEWYFIEVTHRWSRKPITVAGYDGYQIVENLPWWKRIFG